MFPEPMCEIEWREFHCYSITEIFALFRLSEQCRPQTEIRKPDVHCPNASAKPHFRDTVLDRRCQRAISPSNRTIGAKNLSSCARCRCLSSPVSTPSMKKLLLKVRVRTARLKAFFAALVIPASFFPAGAVNAQSLSTAETGIASTHDVV